jgi:two-component system, OmpR family, alkaline phosphatase synthesis response regulator PhoP
MVQQILNNSRVWAALSPVRIGAMVRLLIIVGEDKIIAPLQASLTRYGFTCSLTSYVEALEEAARQPPDLIIAEWSRSDDSISREVIKRIKQKAQQPVIAAVTEDALESLAGRHDIDDFISVPVSDEELVLRINRLLRKVTDTGGENLEYGGLKLDTATCEVTVDGRKVELTFKEYELLKLMAGNKGRVYTREALLDKIWGYDYYGGDRTVDVHIRRLRSKIEDANHTYIETVRNIGYKFTKET